MASGDVVDLDVEESVHAYSANLTELSKPVLRRIRALKKNQLEAIDIEAQYNQRIHELSKEFEPLFTNVFTKRQAIITGAHEPKDDECDVPLLYRDPDAIKTIEENAPAEASPSKGVPEFWLQTMQNTLTLGPMIEDHDAEILKYLVNISYQTHVHPNGFTLFFHFDENPFFANRVLKKEFEVQIAPETDDPFGYDGPLVTKCMGTPIQWHEGKDVTKLEVTDPDTGKKVPAESFFKFFDEKPKQLSSDNEEVENDVIADDFNIGLFIRDELIPRAVLYFTGEKADEYDDEDSISDDEEFVEKNGQAETMEE